MIQYSLGMASEVLVKEERFTQGQTIKLDQFDLELAVAEIYEGVF